MNLHRLESAASQMLKRPIHLVCAIRPVAFEALDAFDHDRLGGFATDRRRQQWLRGRRALLELARKLGKFRPSSAMGPPWTGISLTHDDPLSIAAGVESDAGIGVDLESWRRIDTAMLRWYLTEQERRQPGVASPFTRLRLWTVKEALYKANQSDQGFTLVDFELDDAMALNGNARCRRKRFRYTSLVLRHGILSLAIDG